MAHRIFPDADIKNLRSQVDASRVTADYGSIGGTRFYNISWSIRLQRQEWSFELGANLFASILRASVEIAQDSEEGDIDASSPLWIILQMESGKFVSRKFPRADQYDFVWIWTLLQALYDDDVVEIIIRWMDPLPHGGVLHRGSPTLILNGAGHYSYLQNYEYGPEDYLCAQRALVLLMFFKEYDVVAPKDRSAAMKKQWRLIRRPAINPESKTALLLRDLSLKLSSDAGVDPNRHTDLKNLIAFKNVLSTRLDKECHIQVFSAEQNMEIIFSTFDGDAENGEYKGDFESIEWFNLLLEDEHYTPITRIHKLLGDQRNFCYRCRKTYHSQHHCIPKCSMCGSEENHYTLWENDKTQGAQWQACEKCGRNFFGQECFDNHVLQMCHSRWKCKECKMTFKTEGRPGPRVCKQSEHVCKTIWCKNCEKFMIPDHICFIKPLEVIETNTKYLFCDFEATQETGAHIINLAVTQDFEGNEWVHEDVESWLEFLLQDRWQGYTIIFHNGKGYDFQFIINTILKMPGFQFTVRPILQGAKILYFTVASKKRFSVQTGWRFVDSVNFMPMRLKAFTKTFHLKTKKGYYPHFFNTLANTNYVGIFPPMESFGINEMGSEELEKFQRWYNQNCHREWNNKNELYEYCSADVQLLREGCLQFRSIVMTLTGHDPFRDVTLASSAIRIFRSNYMPHESIGAFPTYLSRELRPALSGGRTGATKLYYKATQGEKLFYVDFTSCYPYVCKNGLYPKGHPIVWKFGDEGLPPSMEENVSIWFVDIDCPQDLYHPLLHGKDPETNLLLFDLRSKKNAGFTNLELLKALELGYVIKHVHVVYYWPETIKGLFKDYIDKFLQVKQCAGGWPRDDMTSMEEKEYITEYQKNEGIKLDPNQIEKNPGMYKVAKLYLNSLWGKFAQRLPEEFVTTQILHSTTQGQRQLNQLRTSKKEIKNFTIISPESIVLTIEGSRANAEDRCMSTNIAVAIFTTAHARLKLYNEILEPLGRQVCYYDTDSAIYAFKEDRDGDCQVPLGKYLGDITNELGQSKYTYEGEYISEFVSGGPKNYGYLTSNQKTSAKIKGHNLFKGNIGRVLNYDAIKANVLLDIDFLVSFNQITRKPGFEVVNRNVQKLYRMAFMKRKVLLPVEKKNELVYIDTEPFKADDPFIKLPKTDVTKSLFLERNRPTKRMRHEKRYVVWIIGDEKTEKPSIRITDHTVKLTHLKVLAYISDFASKEEAQVLYMERISTDLRNQQWLLTNEQSKVLLFCRPLLYLKGKTIFLHVSSSAALMNEELFSCFKNNKLVLF